MTYASGWGNEKPTLPLQDTYVLYGIRCSTVCAQCNNKVIRNKTIFTHSPSWSSPPLPGEAQRRQIQPQEEQALSRRWSFHCVAPPPSYAALACCRLFFRKQSFHLPQPQYLLTKEGLNYYPLNVLIDYPTNQIAWIGSYQIWISIYPYGSYPSKPHLMFLPVLPWHWGKGGEFAPLLLQHLEGL